MPAQRTLGYTLPSPSTSANISLHSASPVQPSLLDSSPFLNPRSVHSILPNFIRGLPPRFQKEDIDYLTIKGALTIPDPILRNELLKSFVNYVHPYLPILDLEEFLQVICANDGVHHLSLLLFQAVMFAGTAFVDLKYLQAAGFPNRKVARKTFFQRTRLLYDFDYEVDRIALVQSLLLMTHWYETPDDQKDTWHWMGVSLSLAHTIGLHRDPANSRMDKRRQRLWRRIWWSTYCRDRLIALGMRRPMRVKDDDSDVSMLTYDDYEFKPSSPEVIQLLDGCDILSDVDHQKQLALMFINKAKLCLIISHVLSAQYSVLSHKFGGSMETTMMLVPKKSSAEADEVRRCDAQLEEWRAYLPSQIQYFPCSMSSKKLSEADEVLHSHRALLKMVYLSTSSALHRPQVLPAVPTLSVDGELQETSRKKVRYAAVEITNIAQDLHNLNLTRFLPTTGVTVILPAVIIHLLDIKASDANVRMISLQRFHQCMCILQRLREIYASADFASSFLEAAIRKAGIQVNLPQPEAEMRATQPNLARRNEFEATTGQLNTLTPPPDSQSQEQKFADMAFSKYSIPTAIFQQTQTAPDTMFVSTPPQSEGSENGSTSNINPNYQQSNVYEFGFGGSGGGASIEDPKLSLTEFMDLANEAEVTQNDFDALINFDEEGADLFAADDGQRHGLNGISTPLPADLYGNGKATMDFGLGDAPVSSVDYANALVDTADNDDSKLSLDAGLL